MQKLKSKLTKFSIILFALTIISLGTIKMFEEVETQTKKTKTSIVYGILNFLEQPTSLVTFKRAEAKEAEPTMKEWVRMEVEKAGLDWEEVDCIVQNESGWKNWNNNWNTNGTIDSGIFMINSVHKGTISLEDRYDYKKATTWAIEKRLHDGHWEAWYGYLNNCK